MELKNEKKTFVKNGLDTKSMILVALFTALTAIGAFLRVPFPTVPFTLQNLFSTMSGLLLGSNLGALAVGIYVLLGLIGVPVFTSGGGIGYVLKPTFGYLLGFIIGAWVTGKIREGQKETTFKNMVLANAAGMILIYVVGITYYYFMATLLLGQEVGAKFLLVNFLLMTLPGDIIKCILASMLGCKLLPALNKGTKGI